MILNQHERKQVFRLFATGKSPEQIVEEFRSPRDDNYRITLPNAEKLYETYIELPIGEKLRLTLMTECVSDRMHRLMDDISDLKRVDTLLPNIDEKTLIPLLDIKRKIKERMAKELTIRAQDQSETENESVKDEFERVCEKIFGGKTTEADML